MARNRFPLSILMALIAVLALGMAALKLASDASARLAIAVATVVLLAGTVGAIVRRPRGGWVGFAVFGWSYVVVLIGVPVLATMLPTIAGDLYETWQVDIPVIEIVDRVHPQPAEPVDLPLAAGLTRSEGKFYTQDGRSYQETPFPPQEATTLNAYFDQQDRWRSWSESKAHARKVAYALQGLIFALVGAAIGQFLARSPKITVASNPHPTDQPG